MSRAIIYTIPGALIGLFAVTWLLGNPLAGIIIGGLLGGTVAAFVNARSQGKSVVKNWSFITLLLLLVIAIIVTLVFGIPVAQRAREGVQESVDGSQAAFAVLNADQGLQIFYSKHKRYPESLSELDERYYDPAKEPSKKLSYAYSEDRQEYHVGITFDSQSQFDTFAVLDDSNFNSLDADFKGGFDGAGLVYDFSHTKADVLVGGSADELKTYVDDQGRFEFEYPSTLTFFSREKSIAFSPRKVKPQDEIIFTAFASEREEAVKFADRFYSELSKEDTVINGRQATIYRNQPDEETVIFAQIFGDSEVLRISLRPGRDLYVDQFERVLTSAVIHDL